MYAKRGFGGVPHPKYLLHDDSLVEAKDLRGATLMHTPGVRDAISSPMAATMREKNILEFRFLILDS